MSLLLLRLTSRHFLSAASRCCFWLPSFATDSHYYFQLLVTFTFAAFRCCFSFQSLVSIIHCRLSSLLLITDILPCSLVNFSRFYLSPLSLVSVPSCLLSLLNLRAVCLECFAFLSHVHLYLFFSFAKLIYALLSL